MIEYIQPVVTAVCASALTAVLGSIWHKQKTILVRYQALQDGVKSVLRSELIRDHGHYTDKGYIPVYAMENVLESYAAYHDLGGNGTITKMVDELKKLPTRRKGDCYEDQ